MTGALTLAGNATANLNPVPLQQLNTSLGGYQSKTGVTDGSNAAAGQVGEYLFASLPLASQITLTTTGTAYAVISLSLTAGDWDVSGVVGYSPSGATMTSMVAGLATTVALPTAPDYSAITAGAANSLPTPVDRFSLTATTTVYLIAYAAFTGGPPKAYGQIRARRVR